jgi:radical SAM protein with 4Fe4S-binding SPASM domain
MASWHRLIAAVRRMVTGRPGLPHSARPGHATMYPAHALPSAVGALEDSIRLAREHTTPPGHLSYGPYVALPPGTYRFCLELDQVRGTPGTAVAAWDIGYFALQALPALARGDVLPGARRIEVTLTLPPAPGRLLEMRLYYLGHGTVGVRHLSIRLEKAHAQHSPLPLPVLELKPHSTWPIDRLRWVVIGTNGLCNASCVHCPTNKEMTRHLPKKAMSWETFEKLIGEIRDSKLTIDGHISLGLFAEPLLDPLVVKRAALVKEYLPNARLVISSNGGPMTEELALALRRYVDIFSIHIEALSPELYRELMSPLRAEQVFPRVGRLIQLCGKSVWITCPTHKKNLHEVQALRDHWLACGAGNVSLSRFSNRCTDALRAGEFALAPVPGGCGAEVAYDLIVDWDGAVLACCQDFLKRNQIGDLRHESLAEVLANPARREVFDKLRAGRWDDFVTCKNCKFDSQAVLDRLVAEAKASRAA